MNHKTKANIFFIWGNFPPDIGGQSALGHRLFRGLSERGYDITVFTSKRPATKIYEKLSTNLRVVRVPPTFPYLLKAGRIWLLLSLLAAIARYISLYPLLVFACLKHRPDIIIKDGITWHIGPKFTGRIKLELSGLAPWILLKKITRAPLIVFCAAVFGLPEYFIKSVAYGADAYIVSDSSRGKRLRELGIKKKVYYLPECINIEEISSLSKPEGNQVLFVGRLSRERGCDTLVKASPEIIRRVPDCKIVVVGDGKEMPILRKMVKEYGIEAYFTFTGAMSPLEVSQFYQKAKVLVNPVRVPEIGNATIEALASGVPVVKSVVEGYAVPPVEDGKNGYLFTADNCIDLADKVVKMLQNSNWQELSLAARETAKQFDLSHSVDKLEEIISQFFTSPKNNK